MQNCIPNSANREESPHNWYSNMFAANIKPEPGIQQDPQQPTAFGAFNSDSFPNYYKQQQQQHHYQPQHPFIPMDTTMINLTPSPTSSQNLAGAISEQQTTFFDSANTGMHQQYQQHFQQGQKAAAQNQFASHFPLGFNPLTPPGLPQAVFPTLPQFYNRSTRMQQTPSPQTLLENSAKATLTPSHTPPMDITPPKSPKPKKTQKTQKRTTRSTRCNKRQSNDPDSMSNSSQDIKTSGESEVDDNIRLPKYNSHGRLKNYKCKTCGLVSITKILFWEHSKTHMRPDKMLQCKRCPFVTELKHHLEYHMRKHSNIKPFTCDKCAYTCVNKSMLNSHIKSHSKIYPYRCITCTYATKYCHSFKVHLRKYAHKQDIVLDEEGVPNPSVIIDVYGTRRGPKNKRVTKKKSSPEAKASSSPQLAAALQGLAETQIKEQPSATTSTASATSDLSALTLSMALQQQQDSSNSQISPLQQQPAEVAAQNANLSHILPPLAYFPYWNLNLQMLVQQQAAVLAQLSPTIREQLQNFQNNEQTNENLLPKEMDKSNDVSNDNEVTNEQEEPAENGILVDSAMDLSQGTPTKDEGRKQTPDLAMNLKLPEETIETPMYSTTAKKSRRKGRVLKLEQEQLKNANTNSAPASPYSPETNGNKMEMPSPSSSKASATDDSMETEPNQINNTPANSSSTFTASSSGNSSNSSSTAFNSNNLTAAPTASTPPSTMFECKYCDIFFKDTVLHTIHMGYHSRDDVFKCNMCGAKCDGPVDLFVHMARNAHS